MNIKRAIYNNLTGDYNTNTMRFFPDDTDAYSIVVSKDLVYFPHDTNLDYNQSDASKSIF